MQVTEEKNRKAGELLFTSIYPLYLQKIKKKGRTVEELNKVIEWLTGFNKNQINKMLNEKTTFKEFFEKAVICLLYTSPSPRDLSTSRMPSSA